MEFDSDKLAIVKPATRGPVKPGFTGKMLQSLVVAFHT
jgi:hypothetical protein